MRKRITILLLVFIILSFIPRNALAQAYSFQIPVMTVDVLFNEDGTTSLLYSITFANDATGHPIDYVDLGLPTPRFDEGSISADVDGTPVFDISSSGFQGDGPGVDAGVAIGLGPETLMPGATGTVHVYVPEVQSKLQYDSSGDQYASAVFAPAWFQTVHGTTDLTVTFHMPPGVQPDEPRWHEAPAGFSVEPTTGIDDQGRVTYTWHNPNVVLNRKYDLGASFPLAYVPQETIYRPGILETLGIDPEDFIGFAFCCGIVGFIGLVSVLSIRTSQKRKLQYLPPRVSIEGHGIKRGLTAVEAAILLEQPLDKVLTMILFSTVKKGAAEVTSTDPLKIKRLSPDPEGLQPYEIEFLKAMTKEDKKLVRTGLQDMMVDLVKSIAGKMKGFSRKETVEYYKDIVQRAWAQVESAATPEVKSEKFAETMEWTMLDKDYDDRTRRTFEGGPVFVPTWWGRYDPTFPRSAPVSTTPGSAPSFPGGGLSLPTLPGANFAASVVRGVESFSGNVVGNISEFTGAITNKTNPVPVSTSSSRSSGGRSSSGGCACACACACAGCACACAGGGR
jgi:hypothetical protein